MTGVNPVLVPFFVLAWLNEEFHLHLLELAVRKMKLPGVISLRKDLPMLAVPNGGFMRDEFITFLKLTKMPVPSRTQVVQAFFISTGPRKVFSRPEVNLVQSSCRAVVR